LLFVTLNQRINETCKRSLFQYRHALLLGMELPHRSFSSAWDPFNPQQPVVFGMLVNILPDLIIRVVEIPATCLLLGRSYDNCYDLVRANFFKPRCIFHQSTTLLQGKDKVSLISPSY
jgi:hypothetical protein